MKSLLNESGEYIACAVFDADWTTLSLIHRTVHAKQALLAQRFVRYEHKSKRQILCQISPHKRPCNLAPNRE